MAISLQKRVKSEMPNNFEPFIPPNSPIYFLKISIPQPKVKIKVPKLIVKALRIRNHGSCTNPNAENKKKRKWTRTSRNLKRVASIFSNVFNYEKSFSLQKRCWSSKNAGSLNRFRETENLQAAKSLKDILKIGDGTKGKKAKIRLLKGKMILKSSSSFSSFFNRKRTSRFNFNKGNKFYGKSEIPYSFGRVNELRMVRKGKFAVKLSIKPVEEESVNGSEYELCKKRILMGVKCRPLNASGALSYDKDGVILPELFF